MISAGKTEAKAPIAMSSWWPQFAGVSLKRMQAIDVQTVVFREGKHFVAQCLDVDVSSFGDSEDDALANLREALELYFEDAPADAVTKVEGPEVRRLTLERA
jgi:predicted RNase H-like HicB family nuclease